MEKYYRVIKENFLWEVGAILKRGNQGSHGGYNVLEDIWLKYPERAEEYISAPIVENSPEYFERVYKSNAEKFLFITADELKKFYTKYKS